jgi:hypothetical protein
LSESEPISFRPREAGTSPTYSSYSGTAHAGGTSRDQPSTTVFDRHELNAILAVYGRRVAAGEWRDYALDMGRDKAVFSIVRRSSEYPLYRIEKNPKLARKQGAYAVVAASGHILKRGHDLRRVLQVLEKSVRLVEA